MKDLWDVNRTKSCTADCPLVDQLFQFDLAFQLSFRPALINSSQVGLPDSFGLETGFQDISLSDFPASSTPLGGRRSILHPKENSSEGSNPLFKLRELQTLTTSPAQVCKQHTDVADCTRLSESTP